MTTAAFVRSGNHRAPPLANPGQFDAAIARAANTLVPKTVACKKQRSDTTQHPHGAIVGSVEQHKQHMPHKQVAGRVCG